MGGFVPLLHCLEGRRAIDEEEEVDDQRTKP